jgi:hypothetical protein
MHSQFVLVVMDSHSFGGYNCSWKLKQKAVNDDMKDGSNNPDPSPVIHFLLPLEFKFMKKDVTNETERVGIQVS